MQANWRRIVLGIAVLGSSTFASATDLTIHLSGTQPLTRHTVQYQCDAHGVSMGLPTGTFSVEYINGAGNSLAIVPVNKTSLIFANVMSGSGARYAAGQYIWWDAAGSVTFYADSLAGKMQSACHRMNTA
jgi:membrane-bound inhibitor of C-type lysozyme